MDSCILWVWYQRLTIVRLVKSHLEIFLQLNLITELGFSWWPRTGCLQRICERPLAITASSHVMGPSSMSASPANVDTDPWLEYVAAVEHLRGLDGLGQEFTHACSYEVVLLVYSSFKSAEMFDSMRHWWVQTYYSLLALQRWAMITGGYRGR